MNHTENRSVSWSGRAHVVSDISDPVLFDVFFDANLPEEAKRMVLSINETNLRGEDLGDVIPCDHLNSAAIYALKNQIFEAYESGDPDNCRHGKLLAETIVPACLQEAENYMSEIGYADKERQELFGKLNQMSISWEWPVEICIDETAAQITDLNLSELKKVLEQMLDDECICGMW